MTSISTQGDARVFIRQFVKHRSGIRLGPDKDYLLRDRLKPVMREWGVASVDELVEQMRRDPQGIGQHVTEALATNESFWFRDNRVWDAIAEHLLPQWRERVDAGLDVNVWSGACSLGQEPYSLVMLLLDHDEPLADHVHIVASDISQRNLKTAREGVFDQLYMSRGLRGPYAKHRQWFTSPRHGLFHLDDRVRQQVSFFQHNLLHPRQDTNRFSLIMLRNVLYYFDEDVQRQVIALVASHLDDDGVLLLGSTERLHGCDAFGLQLESHGKVSWYRRVHG